MARCKFFTSWHIFHTFGRHDILLDIMTYLLTSERTFLTYFLTFWHTFWRNDVHFDRTYFWHYNILMRFTLVMSQKKSNTLFQCMFILSNVSMILWDRVPDSVLFHDVISIIFDVITYFLMLSLRSLKMWMHDILKK